MWIIFAFASSFFAGITSILAKYGMKTMDSNLATALRTIIVLFFSWLIVFITGTAVEISNINQKSIIFLVLSGLSTGASWLCYFKALQIGNINKVTSVDKSSTILTILLAIIFLGEPINLWVICGIILIGMGTCIMIYRRDRGSEKEPESKSTSENRWFMYALSSAFFASLTSILGKVGIQNIDSNLGTAIRTIAVLIMAWVVVFISKKQHDLKNVNKHDLVFLFLSGIATGVSWLCFYRALQDGPASVVLPIDKLSIIVTVIFARIVFKEKVTLKVIISLLFIVLGTMTLLI